MASGRIVCIQGNAIDRDAKMNGLGISEGPMFTLNTVDRHGVAIYENHGQDSRLRGPLDVALTISAKFGTGGNNTPLVLAHGQANAELCRDLCPTLNCNHEQPILIESNQEHATIRADGICTTLPAAMGEGGGYIPMIAHAVQTSHCCKYREDAETYIAPKDQVRRLTPLECERLQGFPDGWTDIGDYINTTGKRRKTSDTPRYKAIGNSIAIPPWRWVLKRIAAQYERNATLASLFDGIGGFPYIWEQLNGPGSAIWASEIEEFPIAVTKKHFPETEAR